MLEQLRQNSRSFIIWVLFAIIIAAFVLTFGTQGEVSFAGASDSGGDFVIVVDDHEVSVHSWRFGMNALRGTDKETRSRQVLDALLRRELLAQAAAEGGVRATEDMAAKMVAGDGQFLILGQPLDGSRMFFRDGIYDEELFERQVNGMGLPSIQHFLDEQIRELEAQNMRDLMLGSMVASPEEAQSRFIYENTRVTTDVVLFRPSEYQRLMVLTQADLDAYLSGHESEVRAKYDTDQALYKERGKEILIRQIVFRRQQPKTIRPGQEEPAADDPNAGPIDPAQVLAREVRERIAAGADFASLARELSEDERSKLKGGSLGWRSAENPALGFQELADAVKTLDKGGLSEVVEITRGFYILMVEDVREGDLSYDQVKHEIAERMAIDDYATKAAQRDAQRALAQAQAGIAEGKSLGDLFERDEAPPRPPGGLNNLPPDMTPEQIQELLRGLQEQGSLTVDGPNKPAKASWQNGLVGQAPAASGDQAAPAPAAQATTTDAAAPAEGADATASAAGSGGSDEIPVPVDLVTPTVRSIGPFTRDAGGVIRGLGTSPELMNALFDELAAGGVAGQVYDIGGSYVVAQLVSRTDPNLADFESNRDERIRSLAFERGFINLRAWLEARCEALIAAQKIGINRPLMNQLATEKEGEEFQYRPRCASLL